MDLVHIRGRGSDVEKTGLIGDASIILQQVPSLLQSHVTTCDRAWVSTVLSASHLRGLHIPALEDKWAAEERPAISVCICMQMHTTYLPLVLLAVAYGKLCTSAVSVSDRKRLVGDHI